MDRFLKSPVPVKWHCGLVVLKVFSRAQIMTEFHDTAKVELDEVAAKIALMDDRFKSAPPLLIIVYLFIHSWL